MDRFLFLFPCKDFINTKKKIYFSGEAKDIGNFPFFLLLHKLKEWVDGWI